MPRYLVEVPHSESELECALAVRSFLQSGSHYLTNADWGCEDGVHSAWIVIEAENRETARWVVPPVMRRQACVTRLTKFTGDEIDAILASHGE